MGLLDLIFGKPKKSTDRPGVGLNKPSPKRTSDEWCDLPIVGESNYQDALVRICGGYTRDGHQLHTRAQLIPEPSNRFDENAIRVEIDDQTVGYLKRDHAARYSKRLLDEGRVGEVLNVRAYISGGWRINQHDSGHFGVQLERPWPLKRRVAKQ